MSTSIAPPLRHALVAFGLVAASVTGGPVSIATSSQTVRHQSFSSPEEAVQALVKSVRAGSVEGLLGLFGPDGEELLETSDPVTARRNREVFKIAAAEKWALVDAGTDRKTLVVGNEDWPFPVPLVKDARGWRFDTAAGKDEIIARRIGRNELSAIGTCRAYVAAQLRYAQEGHDGQPAGVYATRFASDPGKQNGLYWPTARGEKRSPLGDLLAAAGEDEGTTKARGGKRAPLEGYYFKILVEQGRSAPGGRKSYLANGLMTRGFALVAWPAQYAVTGVMTFVVNRDGIVYEKDLGPDTTAAVQKLTAYNPDSSWQGVK
jgi:hypothetical protein